MMSATNSAAAAPRNINSLNQINEVLNTGGEHLGDVTWWRLAEADVERSVLEAVWLGAGLDKALLPAELTPEKALRQAVRDTATGLKDILIRKGQDDKAYLAFAVVLETRLGEGKVKYDQLATVALNKATGAISADNPNHDTVKDIVTAYAKYTTTHTSRDVMTSITKALTEWCAVSLREKGGVYWVPRTRSEEIRKLRTAVSQLGSSAMYLMPVHAGADTNAAIGEAAVGALETDLAKIREEIDGFLTNGVDGTHTGTLERRLEVFSDLRARADLYRSILNVTVEDLGEQVDAMEASVHSLLAMKAAGKI